MLNSEHSLLYQFLSDNQCSLGARHAHFPLCKLLKRSALLFPEIDNNLGHSSPSSAGNKMSRFVGGS
jgi:hypothetical protein